MSLPQQILVPTDFSDGAEQALAYAVELAARLGATVHLLNVIGVPMLGVPELGVAVTGSILDSLTAQNRASLDELAERTRHGVTVGQVLLRTGDARDTILDVAAEIGAELIVMGTHGRHGVSRVLLGSIAESVVRSSSCPVLTVRVKP